MKVIILCGYPGSGKSTYAKKLESEGYKVVNQDKLGSRQACLHELEGYLIRKHNVVIDRTNINKQQRKYFVEKAIPYGAEIECIVMCADQRLCLDRIHKRENHDTIPYDMSFEKKEEIINKFVQNFERPEIEEGFEQIIFKKAY